MNLLTDEWLPVRSIDGGTLKWITLAELLTTTNEYEICLPRDDLEMAALQLVICITQVLFTPDNLEEVMTNIQKPLAVETYYEGIRKFEKWFDLTHQDYPFMQVRGVNAKDITPMDKLLPGLTGATNSCLVNEAGQANQLCGACAAIALFNQASNTPSFGGGFKAGLRGSAPITTLIQGRHVRETVWLNILSSIELEDFIPSYQENLHQPPTWVQPIEEKSNVMNHSIGLLRGLLWQPAHVELCPPENNGRCYCCGRNNVAVFNGFLKAKFNYTIQGLWPHLHSPRLLTFKKTEVEEKFASFTTPAPTWTRLASFVVQKSIDKNHKEGHQPAATILQARKLFFKRPDRMRLAIGGYRNNQASILERRHELFDLNQGWHQEPAFINELVTIGLEFKTALRKSLFVFSKGIKELKGAGVALQDTGESQFFRRTDGLMQKALAEAHFTSSDLLAFDKDNLRSSLKQHCIDIFEEQTRPYLNDPELVRTLAMARRTLYRNFKSLASDAEGGEHGRT